MARVKQGYLTMLNIGRYGRFANAAWQIAAVLGIAKKNNLEPVFPLWINHDHKERFGSNEDVEVYKYFVHQLPSIPEGIQWQPERPVGWGYHDVVLGPGNWHISGHFQSWKYFDNSRDQIQHYFRMRDEPPLNDRIAIHYRARDYQENGDYHPRMPLSYYEEAMNLFPNGKFLVFSDESETAKQMFGDRVEYAEGDYIEDFRLLKTCSHFIVANSSYSAMAAVLGEHPEKRVIAPRPWFGKSAGINAEDLYGTGWEVLNWQ